MAGANQTLQTIDLVYRAAVEPWLWPEALHQFALATGGIGTAMIPITPMNTSGLVVSEGLAEPNVEYEREWWRRDTRVARIFDRGLSGGVCCEAELFTEEELAKDPLRQEFLRSYGVGAFAAQLVRPMPDFVVAFSVQRALRRGHFDSHELQSLKLLGKHTARALLVSTRLAAGHAIGRTLINTLEHNDCGAIVVDREMNVIIANGAAEGMFGDGIEFNRQRLRASLPKDQAAFVRLIRSALRIDNDTGSLETIALKRPSGKRPLLVQAIPIIRGDSTGPIPMKAAALVIAVDPEHDTAKNSAGELRLLGLAPSEARLAALIGMGITRTAAAELLGITAATANDTLKHVYAKLDISRQSDLVRIVGRLAVLASRKES